jgi:hypothetical protein
VLGWRDRPAPRNAIYDKKKSIEFVQPPEGRHRAGWARIASGRRLHASDKTERCAQIGDTTRSQFIALNDAQVSRNLINIFGYAGRRDLDGRERTETEEQGPRAHIWSLAAVHGGRSNPRA